jgi:hypothetical protein
VGAAENPPGGGPASTQRGPTSSPRGVFSRPPGPHSVAVMHENPDSRRWLWLAVIVAIVVALLVAVVLLSGGGGHGPGRHL